MASSSRRLAAAGAGSSWSVLPDGVLVDIVGRLHTLQDFFAVRAVCRNWRIAASASPETLSSQSPLLIFTSNESEFLYDIAARSLYSLHSSGITLDYSHGHFISVFSKYRVEYPANTTVILSNLFTGSQICLSDIPDDFGRVLLSARPGSADCLVVLLSCNLDVVQYLKLNDSSWTVVLSPQLAYVHDMMFFQRELFALTMEMEVVAVELTGNSLGLRKLGGGRVAGMKEYFHACLGEMDGVMLMVCNYFFMGADMFDVFKWNSEKNGWEEILDLGDKALFVSVGRNAVSVSATDLGLRNNCVYWTHYLVGKWVEFSLKDRSSERVTIDELDLGRAWFNPSFWIFPSNL